MDPTDRTGGAAAREGVPVLLVAVDGIDLAGKSTLIEATVHELGERGVSAARHRGMLTERHPLDRPLRRLSLARQQDSAFTTTAYLFAGFALDNVLARLRPPLHEGCAVLIQDGYVDRTVAFGIAGGPYLAARAALRWPGLFAPCDLAVHVTADIGARARRLDAGREHIDVRDERSARDEPFSDRFHQALAAIGRRHRRLITIDTTDRDTAETAGELAGTILALLSRAAR
ncbi:hypothetical protein ACFC26_17365 [Kitasatospora purpeofusca]|uniref:hypothetical protein n=1 Tax=Kitasatospora purpeofusca TaxID=67352 RepID=UPI0035DB67C1